MLGMARQNPKETAEECMFFDIPDLKLEDLYDWGAHVAPGINKKGTLSTKTGKKVTINKTKIALFRFGDDVYAIDEKCPHVGGPLHLGDIETLGEAKVLCVVCPWHKWKISLQTGKVKLPDRPRFARVYPIKVLKDGELKIGFESFSAEFFKGDEDF